MSSILVIDDNKHIRENTAEILELAGYKVYTAENGKRGVEIALKESPSLIVCDIMMPELDGYGVFHLLQKNKTTENIPFIFLTAKIERADFRKGMEMGAADYITKPFDEIELLKAIEIRMKKKIIAETTYSSANGINDFLRDIKNAGLNDIDNRYETRQYHKKNNLYTERYRPKFLFYLIKGTVKGYRSTEEGKEYITDLFNAGDFIGYSPLIQEINYEDSAIVLQDAEVLLIPGEDFLKLLNSDTQIAGSFIRIMSNNIKEKEERLLTLAYSSLRKRVAKTLVGIHHKYNSGNPQEPLQISREDIARYVGAATESLIRTLSDFKAEKLIEIKEAQIFIRDISKLENLLN